VYGPKPHYGLFYGGGGRLLGCQVIGILVIAGWVIVNMTLFFGVFKFLGRLRISAEEEQAGLDVSKHGGSAYNYDSGLGARPGGAAAAGGGGAGGGGSNHGISAADIKL